MTSTRLSSLALFFLSASAVAIPPGPRRLRESAPRETPTARAGTEADHAWLLRPEVFEKLSSGGRRAALVLNGLLPVSDAASTAVAEETSSAPTPLAPAAFQNVRVNNPSLDML